VSPPHTYRDRLFIYTTLLVVFLVGVLFFFFTQSRQAILSAADRNTGLFVAEIEAKLRLENHQLQQSARLISNNAQLQQFMYTAVSNGAERNQLEELFTHQLGWLAFDSAAIVSSSGQVLYGNNKSSLVGVLKRENPGNQAYHGAFYYADRQGVHLASSVPVYRQNIFLGNVILSTIVDQGLIEAARKSGYGQIFVEKGGRILRSSLANGLKGHPFRVSGGSVSVGNELFLVKHVALSGAKADIPWIWFGLSDPELVDRLDHIRTEMLLLAAGGTLAILLVGMLLMRNFSGPVGRLVRVMREVGDGRIPELAPASDRDEIGYLTNQFHLMLQRLREHEERVRYVQTQLEEQASTDALTGLYNRRYLYELFPKLAGEAERQGKTVTLILLDLDYFKRINDEHGHLVGDRVLAHVAKRILKCCRVSDFVFRFGGEEFLLVTVGDGSGGEILAEKIRQDIEQNPMMYEGKQLRVTGSFGVARMENRDGDDALRAALTRADKALYSAKHGGRNRVVLWDLRQVSG
jgi:diguanylate cyclase (GGDEF)-like protein